MTQIFISYSRADRQFIDQFTPLIRRVYGNDSIWFDEDISGGTDWWQTILHEIGVCDLFVFLVSNEALESQYCQKELREALRLNKRVLPVVVRRLSPSYPGGIDEDLAKFLRKTQYVDMSTGCSDARAVSSLYASINQLQVKNHPIQSTKSQISTPTTTNIPVKNKRTLYSIGIFILFIVIVGGVIDLIQRNNDNTSITSPTNIIEVDITHTPIANPSYPCDGNILVVTSLGEGINIVRSLPRENAPAQPIAIQGEPITIINSQITQAALWFQIHYSNNTQIGWILETYIELTDNCP